MRKEAGMEAEPYTDNVLRKGIVNVLDTIGDCIMYFKWFRPLKKEKDPEKRLEIQLWLEISGARLGGMASSGAYVTFKTDYYDKLPEDEKTAVRKTLLTMLRSDSYTVLQKDAIVYVCSSLRMEEASKDIALVREASARGMSMRQLYRYKRDWEREMRRHNLL
jgi:hypothetical protein